VTTLKSSSPAKGLYFLSPQRELQHLSFAAFPADFGFVCLILEEDACGAISTDFFTVARICCAGIETDEFGSNTALMMLGAVPNEDTFAAGGTDLFDEFDTDGKDKFELFGAA
jgi:hypothetical protein